MQQPQDIRWEQRLEHFKKGLIEQGEAWMDMIKSRNLSNQTYNQKVADYLAEKVIDSYVSLFDQLSLKLSSLFGRCLSNFAPALQVRSAGSASASLFFFG